MGFFLGHEGWLVGSYFPNQGLNPDHSNASHSLNYVHILVHCPSLRKSVMTIPQHQLYPRLWAQKEETCDSIHKAFCLEKPQGCLGGGRRRHVDTEGTEKQLRPRVTGLGLMSFIIRGGWNDESGWAIPGGGNPGIRTRAEGGTLEPSLVQRYEAELKQPER